MITFPEISKPSYPLGIELENNSLMSKFEDGTVQSRKNSLVQDVHSLPNGIVCPMMNILF